MKMRTSLILGAKKSLGDTSATAKGNNDDVQFEATLDNQLDV
jgi:hypothetical protein